MTATPLRSPGEFGSAIGRGGASLLESAFALGSAASRPRPSLRYTVRPSRRSGCARCRALGRLVMVGTTGRLRAAFQRLARPEERGNERRSPVGLGGARLERADPARA